MNLEHRLLRLHQGTSTRTANFPLAEKTEGLGLSKRHTIWDACFRADDRFLDLQTMFNDAVLSFLSLMSWMEIPTLYYLGLKTKRPKACISLDVV